MAQGKTAIITFKAEPALVRALSGVPNRSEFIRSAVLAALESACPLCLGTGILTPGQQRHWREFARTHSVEACRECHELHVVCAHDAPESDGGEP